MNTPDCFPIRNRLGEALLEFVPAIIQASEMEDAVLRRVVTGKFRREVERAAAKGVEMALAWHTLGVWTEEGRERVGYFARALERCQQEAAATPPQTPKEKWSALHMEADSLFEIGRVHFHEGDPAAARGFLTQALELARQVDALQAPAGITDDRLEGRVAELLLQLPDA